MADTKISDLTAAAALSATDTLPIVQTPGAGPVKATPAQIKTYVETAFTQAESTIAPNNTVYADSLTAKGASTNADACFVPKGTGAICAGVPDGTATGGNKRGTYATDWQHNRSAGTQVASGNYSTIAGGYENTASGERSFIGGGYSHTTSGTQSAICGGYDNQASGQGSFVGGGESNNATATQSVVSGGAINDATGYRSTIGGGYDNTSLGQYSTIAGGYTNSSSGDGSWIPGGYEATTRGLTTAYAYSSGQRAAQGDAQVIGQPVRRTTSDATPVSLATDGTPAATTVMVIPANSAVMCRAQVVARSSTGDVAGFELLGVFKRDGAGNTTVVGAPTVITVASDAGLATATCTLVANDTLEAVEIQVTGIAATTIYWMGELRCVQAA